MSCVGLWQSLSVLYRMEVAETSDLCDVLSNQSPHKVMMNEIQNLNIHIIANVENTNTFGFTSKAERNCAIRKTFLKLGNLAAGAAWFSVAKLRTVPVVGTVLN